MSAEDNGHINLFELGYLVDLSIGSWSGRKMITMRDLRKLGFDTTKLPPAITNPGRKLLVPKQELLVINRIEQRARTYLDQWSVAFGIGNSHFVPLSVLPEVEEQLKDLRAEFLAAVDSFIARFDQMKQAVNEAHPEFWENCLKDVYPADPTVLRDRFRFRWFFFKVAGAGVTTEGVTLEEAQAADRVAGEREREMREKMKAEVGNFVEEYVSAMRGETVRFCDLLSARINGTPFEDEAAPKKLTPRSLKYFRKYVDRFRRFNIFGDDEIEKMLAAFRSEFMGGEETPKNFQGDGIKSAVTAALSKIRTKAANDSEQTSKFVNRLRRRVVI
ncbi:MAG: DUF3150 domain-containing protein [bacterium]|nr:DUF3150 domain-containing protein [bacterium]